MLLWHTCTIILYFSSLPDPVCLGTSQGADMEKKIVLWKLQHTTSKKSPRIFVLILFTSIVTAAYVRSYLSLQISLALFIMSQTFPWCSLHPLELAYIFSRCHKSDIALQILHIPLFFAFIVHRQALCSFVSFCSISTLLLALSIWESLLWKASGVWQHWDERQNYFQLISSDHNP